MFLQLLLLFFFELGGEHSLDFFIDLLCCDCMLLDAFLFHLLLRVDYSSLNLLCVLLFVIFLFQGQLCLQTFDVFLELRFSLISLELELLPDDLFHPASLLVLALLHLQL